ncbi:MAG: prepilin peptidase [Patescibacteria group bacterium]
MNNLGYYLLVIIFGLIVGSFLNAVIYRLHQGKSFIRGRSFCPQCGHSLSAMDLVPILSFILLGGRCRYCDKKISWQYPLVEFFVAVSFVIIYFTYGWSLQFVFYLIITAFLALIFVYDLKYHLILDKVSLPALFLAFIFSLILKMPVLEILIGLVIGAGFFFLQFTLSRGKWVGGGDIRLGGLMGAALGWQKLLAALFLAYISGSLVSLFLIIFRRKTMKSRLPFGPFLVVAAFVCLIFGQAIIDWYLEGSFLDPLFNL